MIATIVFMSSSRRSSSGSCRLVSATPGFLVIALRRDQRQLRGRHRDIPRWRSAGLGMRVGQCLPPHWRVHWSGLIASPTPHSLKEQVKILQLRNGCLRSVRDRCTY